VTIDALEKAIGSLKWLPQYAWHRVTRRLPSDPTHLIIAVANHFEPSFLATGFASPDEQAHRLDRWCLEYPRMADRWRDSDGRPFRHTYFYPAEQYDARLIERLARHCGEGWGEIEIHLHHGIQQPDNADNTRRVLLGFRNALVEHGCLSRWNGGEGPPRYAFVHGNWALANSGGGRYCGVDEEMQILAETGCYADFTLPSAPNRAQIAKINALYECALPLAARAPHRLGRDLRVGRPPDIFPLMIQGPLGLRLEGFTIPRIENAELTTVNPPTLERLHFWCRTPITVKGRPDWVFIKLHCHGMDARDEAAMFGALMEQFLQDITRQSQQRGDCFLHFVTAREMVNIALAACDGHHANPGEYRDYRLRLAGAPARA
jgi:hypothetical protein